VKGSLENSGKSISLRWVSYPAQKHEMLIRTISIADFAVERNSTAALDDPSIESETP